MNKYIQIEFKDISTEQAEWLIAQLNEIGFEGFEETDKTLNAFVSFNSYNETALKEIASKRSLKFVKKIIEETNWNEVWESNFRPVVVDDFVAIRADFHEPIKGVEHEIIITPKMSFGTGHHATTYMMIRQMKGIDFTNKAVFDFGTGTGVLAILAEKSGAKKIIAIDNDDWSIMNAKENIEKNNCSRIQLLKAGNADMNGEFDIILANINKNVILDNFSFLIKQLQLTGVILLSGLLTEDETEILKAANQYHMAISKKLLRDNWLSLRLIH